MSVELLGGPSTQTTVRTMKAAVVTGPRRIAIRKVPIPTPGSGQVRVRMTGCGVCASNVVPWEGPDWMRFPTLPGALGHEGWGVVDVVGCDVTSVKPGDRVATLFMHSYAEYDVGDADAVVRLPPSVAEQEFPGEPLGCAMNILRRCQIGPGDHVAIVGIGFLGALLTSLAIHAGARVIALSRREFSRNLARLLGAAQTAPSDDRHVSLETVAHATAGRFCDVVIEATGKQKPLDLAGELVAERGRLVVAGYHQDGHRQVNMQQWNWKGIDVINAHERDPQTYVRGVRDAIGAVEQGALHPEALFTHRFPLEG
ncbi:zinc-binding dehydrogenase, partial [Rhizobiaceae sp. 2RAB30]